MLGNAGAALPDGSAFNCPDNMRYGDIWEKRDGEWKMLQRDLIMDWNAAWPYSGQEGGFFAEFKNRGVNDRSDLAYKKGLVVI